MSFSLQIPTVAGEPMNLELAKGQALFVLGANGSGKSSLMLHFAQSHYNATKIAAHRQTWFDSDTVDITPSSKTQTQREIRNQDKAIESRFRDPHGGSRSMVILYDLIDSVAHSNESVANAVRAGDYDKAKREAEQPTSIDRLNNLLRSSNIPVHIEYNAARQVMACKNGVKYGVREMSDGERNVLLIAGEILTVRPGTLVVIDEPERHLHRSIISPLLGQVFRERPDCSFVIATHDYGLPLEHPEARILLLRSCNLPAQQWEVDLLPPNVRVDDIELKRDLLGARRTVIFVEGAETSLDRQLYSVIFPGVSVIPRGSCRDVEHTVRAAQSLQQIAWLTAFGIIDSDGRDNAEVEAKHRDGIYAVPYYSVEAIYYHNRIVELLATRIFGDGQEAKSLNRARSAIMAGIAKVNKHTERLSLNAAKRAARRAVVAQIPNDDDLLNASKRLAIDNRSQEIYEEYTRRLVSAVESANWREILKICPIRESGAPDSIARELGLRHCRDYEGAVRKLLAEDSDARQFVRGLFGDLETRLDESP